jgi:hypothetical protein
VIRVKLIVLALALALSAALMARAASTTNANFSDTKAGTISGTLGSWATTCTLEAGSSKAVHRACDGQDTPRVLPIARFDGDGRLYLDFGDLSAGNSNSSPDVFRLVSQDTVARRISFASEGEISPMIGAVALAHGASLLAAGAASRVSVKLRIPTCKPPGEYRGTLVISVGGAGLLRVPMTLTVLGKGRGKVYEIVPTSATTQPKAPSTPVATPSPLATEVTPSPQASSGSTTPTPGARSATPSPEASSDWIITSPTEPPP